MLVVFVMASFSACMNRTTDGETNIDSSEIKSVQGELVEKKDFMFVIEEDETKAYLPFAFEEKPEGYDELSLNDNITIQYIGEVSEIDAFNGTIISIEKH